MKILMLLITTIVCLTTNAQYSGYYKVDVNKNENINIKGNISTIDYGKLALANAENEKTRLENQKYSDAKQRQIALDIAMDPLKAFDYSYPVIMPIKGEAAKNQGFKKLTVTFTNLNISLFTCIKGGQYQNVSTNGITCELNISCPAYNKTNIKVDIEKREKMDSIKIGQFNVTDYGKFYVHKKDLNIATVFGFRGFKSSLVLEDYQYTIIDNYYSFNADAGNGIQFFIQVRIYGDKDEVTFEQLEGRRYYLRNLVEKVIATADAYDIKY